MMVQVFVGLLSLWLVGCNAGFQYQSGAGTILSVTPITGSSTATLRSTATGTPTAESSPTTTPSQTPEPTPSPSIIPTSTETPTPTALPQRVYFKPMNHQWQSLNNCHRASIAILMGYYGVWLTQHDHDLAMDSLDEFLSSYDLGAGIYAVTYAEVRPSQAVRWLLAEGIPVIMGQDLSTEDHTWHYRVVHGYDDQAQEFTIDDPLLGLGLHLSYDTFDRLSRGEGHIIPVYPRDLAARIAATMKNWQMKRIIYPHN